MASVYDFLQPYFNAQVSGRQALQQHKAILNKEAFDMEVAELRRRRAEKMQKAEQQFDLRKFLSQLEESSKDRSQREKMHQLDLEQHALDRLSEEKINAARIAADNHQAALRAAGNTQGGRPRQFEVDIQAQAAMQATPFYQENAPKADAARAVLSALGKSSDWTDEDPERKQIMDANSFLQTFLRDSTSVGDMIRNSILKQTPQSSISEDEWDEFYNGQR